MVHRSTATTLLLLSSISVWSLSFSSIVDLQTFCTPVTWSEAAANCEKEGGRLVMRKDFTQPYVGNYFTDAKASGLHTIWINKTINGTDGNACTVVDKDGYRHADCEEEHHYVCLFNNSGNNTSSGTPFKPCPPTQSTQRAVETTPRDVSSSSATPPGNTDISAVTTTDENQSGKGLNLSTTVYIVLGCLVALILIIVVTVLILKKRNRKPGIYAVREESARYHREHGDICRPAYQSQNDLNEDYDILWNHANSAQEAQPREDESGCASYGHIMPFTDTNNPDIVYDITYSNKVAIDKVHNNVYDRTYPPEQAEPSLLTDKDNATNTG